MYADTSKGLYKLFHKSHFALAGLVPATLALPSDGFPAKLADVGLAAVLPLHSHVAMNSGEWNSTQRARSRSEINYVASMELVPGSGFNCGSLAVLIPGPHAFCGCGGVCLPAVPWTRGRNPSPGPLPQTVVTDYVPKALQLPARAGVIGLSAVTFIGLMKLSLTGDGIGGTVKKIWAGPQKA